MVAQVETAEAEGRAASEQKCPSKTDQHRRSRGLLRAVAAVSAEQVVQAAAEAAGAAAAQSVCG